MRKTFNALVFRMTFCFLLGGLFKSVAIAHPEDASKKCVTAFDHEIGQTLKKELYVPGTDTGKAIKDFFDCFKRHGDYDFGIIVAPWMLIFMPFRILGGIFKTVKTPVDAVAKEVTKSKYGKAFFLLKRIERMNFDSTPNETRAEVLSKSSEFFAVKNDLQIKDEQAALESSSSLLKLYNEGGFCHVKEMGDEQYEYTPRTFSEIMGLMTMDREHK